MANIINGQLILEEEYDENYQPTEQGIMFYTGATNLKFTFNHLGKMLLLGVLLNNFLFVPKHKEYAPVT